MFPTSEETFTYFLFQETVEKFHKKQFQNYLSAGNYILYYILFPLLFYNRNYQVFAVINLYLILGNSENCNNIFNCPPLVSDSL